MMRVSFDRVHNHGTAEAKARYLPLETVLGVGHNVWNILEVLEDYLENEPDAYIRCVVVYCCEHVLQMLNSWLLVSETANGHLLNSILRCTALVFIYNVGRTR